MANMIFNKPTACGTLIKNNQDRGEKYLLQAGIHLTYVWSSSFLVQYSCREKIESLFNLSVREPVSNL